MSKRKRKHKKHNPHNHATAGGGPSPGPLKGEKIAQELNAEKSDKNTNERTSKADKMASRIWGWIKKETTFTNLTIAIFTVVIAGVGILQWSVIGGQLDEMRSDQRDR